MSIAERGFAVVYDRMNAAGERTWMGRRREAMLADVEGRVLEIGGGTGANLPHYGADADVVMSEPSAAMRARVGPHLAGSRAAVEVSAAGAQALPFPDATFDVVVATLVLCTIPDVRAALREVRRVLRPDGRLLFLEHGGGAAGRRGTWQRRLDPLWSRLACGCHLDRDARTEIEAAGLRVVEFEEWDPPRVPGLLRPFAQGVAVP